MTNKAPIFDGIQAFGNGPNAHPKYSENQGKAMGRTAEGYRFHADQSVCCCYCGKYTGTGSLFLYLTSYGEVSSAEHFGDDEGDNLGMYPIGSDCAKKAKSAGAPIYKGDPVVGFVRL